jgi:flagellar basal body L-ring protein FlgH
VKSEVAERYAPQQEAKNLKILNKKDTDYERQLERVLNEYTPLSDQKKKTFNSKYSEKRVAASNINDIKYIKTKYSVPSSKDRSADFKKKSFEPSTKVTVKKTSTAEQSKRDSLQRLLRNVEPKAKAMSSKKIMEINL